MKKMAGLILWFCIVCLLAACQPAEAKTECASLEKVKEQLDFPIILPVFAEELAAQDYRVTYFLTRALPNGGAVTGYCAELFAQCFSCTGYERIQVSGANIEREKDAAQPYNFAATYDSGYVRVIEQTPAVLDGRDVTYSAYRRVAQNGAAAQKSIAPSVEDPSFDTFYAETVLGGIRYSVLIGGLAEDAPEEMEARGLAIARQIFRSLFEPADRL